MKMEKYKWIIVVITTLVLIEVSFIFAKSTIPQRWNEELVGLPRENVHSILGYPDANFMPKGWEGWSQGVVVGAWVLRVGYDGDEKVINVTHKFHWGFDHYSWSNDWKEFLSE